jgi:hypothetical protein
LAALLGAYARSVGGPDGWLLGLGGLGFGSVLEVEDVEGCHDRVAASGHPILEPLRDRPWRMRDFGISDPDGYYLRVTSRPAGE